MSTLAFKIIVGIVSGLLGTVNLMLDKGIPIRLTIYDVYRSILYTGWAIIIASVWEIAHKEERSVRHLFVGFGIVIAGFVAIRMRLFVRKTSLVHEMIRSQANSHSAAIQLQEKLHRQAPLAGIIKRQRAMLEKMDRLRRHIESH